VAFEGKVTIKDRQCPAKPKGDYFGTPLSSSHEAKPVIAKIVNSE
jgi:hypothetical protein